MKTKWHFRGRRWALGLALMSWLPFLSSCACYVPVPTLNENHGRRMKREEVCFIQPGRTSRAEVYARLGTNYVSLPMERAIAYSWECKGLSFPWYFVISGLSSGEAFPTGYEMAGKWQAYFVAFDNNNIAQAVKFKRLAAELPLQEQLDLWFSRLPNQPQTNR